MSDISTLINNLTVSPEEKRLRELIARSEAAGQPMVRAYTPPPLPDRRVLAEAGLLDRIKPSVSSIINSVKQMPSKAAAAVKSAPGALLDEVKAAAGSKLFDRKTVAVDRMYTPPKDFTYAELKAALGFTESSGNPNAKSNAKNSKGQVVGARGLYQIMPETAEWIAGKAGIPWKGEKALYDPKYNSQIADAYWNYLSKKYNGDLSLTLAAYNHGEGNLQKLMDKFGTKDISKFFKELPEETRRHHNTTIAKLRFNKNYAD